MKKITTNEIILFVIIIIAITLRCIGYFSAPFTHDELSAIYRLYFDNFNDLIHQGVYVDGHPAGIQVFLWIWTKIFGMSEIMVRLPFLLMGICCVPLIYKIGKIWFNKNAALAAAAIVAVSQYTVYYSIIARPYIAGLFLVLLLLLFWSKIIFGNDYRKTNFVLIAVFAACCAYTHYFAMMTAFFICFAGLFFINKQQIKSYLLACLGSVLLFTPHLPVTHYQLFVLTGLEWLATPESSFLFYYLFFLLHYSVWMVLTFVIVFAISGNFSKTHLKSNAKKIILSLTLFALPLIVGYTYSVKIKPVIQYSCLIFSYPFIVLFICAFFDKEKSTRKICALVIFTIAMIFSLVFSRRHYDMLPRQQFEKTVQKANEYNQKYGAKNVCCWVRGGTAFYERKNNCTIENRYQSGISYPDLIKIIESNNFQYAIVSEMKDPNILKIFKDYFPVIEYYYPCLRSELYVFAKEGTPADNLPKTYYSVSDSIRDFDINADDIVLLDKNLKDISVNRFSQIYAKVDFDTIDTYNNYQLVYEFWDKDNLYVLQTISTAEYYELYGKKNYIDFVPCFRTESVIKNSFLRRNYRVKVFLRNLSKASNARPTHFCIENKETNRYIYCLPEDAN